MIVAALLPFALALALSALAPSVARRCRPRVAAGALTAAALVVALSTGLVLCAVATLALTEVPFAGQLGHWSAGLLAHREPVGRVPGTLAGAVAVVLAGNAVRHLVRSVRSCTAAARSAARCDPDGRGLVVVPDERAFAFAVPGLRRGRTVVSRGLLRSLDAGQRRALLAHEDAHLRHRHVLYVQLSELAAAANPVLRPVVRAVRLAIECWADEDAARLVGDRRTVASALARAGSMWGHGGGDAVLCAAASHVGQRVTRLVDGPPPRATVLIATLPVLTTSVAAVSAAVVGLHAHAVFELAQAAYHR